VAEAPTRLFAINPYIPTIASLPHSIFDQFSQNQFFTFVNISIFNKTSYDNFK